MRRLFNSFKYAWEGLIDLFRSTPNARIHLLAAMLVVFLAWYLQMSPTEWAILLLCIGLVFGFEALNTSIEYLTDRASPDIHPLAKKTKDMAAAAVLIVSLFALIVGLIIILPKIIG